MIKEMTDFDERRSLVRHSWTAFLAIFCLFAGLIYWASTIVIAGAVLAAGSIVVESYPKLIQHQEGGTVSEIYVRNEDKVEAGQVLFRLDSTGVTTVLRGLKSQWCEALIREARLRAEVEGQQTFVEPVECQFAASPAYDSLVSVERQVMTARRTTREGRVAQLIEQVAQLQNQIEGYSIQQAAVEEQLSLLKNEIEDLEELLSKGLVESSRVTAVVRQRAQLDGERGRLISISAGARAAIAETQLQIAQVKDDFVSAALDELQTVRRAIFDTEEKITAAQDQLTRTEVRAPEAGVVHESVVHTVGGVVRAGETLMQIVPQNDNLVVALRLSPMDIDRVTAGQEARLRLVSLDYRETPELAAFVATVAPNITRDPNSGQQFYSAQVTIPDEELARLPNSEVVVPGMPVEAFIRTTERTVLTYLIQPFVEQLSRVMRED